MKKILISVLTIALVGVAAFGASRAFFSDTETSVGNTFTAGEIDLKVGANITSQHNGNAVFAVSDLDNRALFNFTDLKPGDTGAGMFTVQGTSNEYWACMKSTITGDNENTLLETEGAADTNATGELDDYLEFAFWNDKNHDGIYNAGDSNLVGPFTPAIGGMFNPNGLAAAGWLPLADSTGLAGASFFQATALSPNTPYDLGFKYCFGHMDAALNCDGTGDQNNAQSDSLVGTLDFYAVQSRNNLDFKCSSMNTQRVVHTQNGFGDGGWAGWSCPAGTTAIGGGIISSTNAVGGHGVAAPSAPSVDGATYPEYPHHTFVTGDTGYVVHDLPGDSLGNNITFYVDCLPN